MNLSELAQYISDEEKAEQVLREKGVPHVRSAGRIILGESGDSSSSAIVVTKSGEFGEEVSWKD